MFISTHTAPRTFAARYNGSCLCGAGFSKGAAIYWDSSARRATGCPACIGPQARAARVAVAALKAATALQTAQAAFDAAELAFDAAWKVDDDLAFLVARDTFNAAEDALDALTA
tara:strand:+ start:378 stop:719 length:342 start_codon:yes stop_codon:yes gene_type:complete